MHTNTSRILTSFSDLDHAERRGLPVESRHSVVPASLCGHLRPRRRASDSIPGSTSSVAARDGWLVEHSGTTRRPSDRVVVASGRFQSPCIPARSRTRRFHRRSRSEVHVRLSRATCLPRQTRPRRGRRHQRPVDRCRNRPGRRCPRRGLPAAAALRPAEVRRGSALRLSDIHAVRNARERAPSPQRRSTGNSRRSSSRPVETQNSTARRRQILRFSPPVAPSAQQYLPLVAEGRITIRPWMTSVHGRDRDLRRRRMPRSSTEFCSAPGSSSTCRS